MCALLIAFSSLGRAMAPSGVLLRSTTVPSFTCCKVVKLPLKAEKWKYKTDFTVGQDYAVENWFTL